MTQRLTPIKETILCKDKDIPCLDIAESDDDDETVIDTPGPIRTLNEI